MSWTLAKSSLLDGWCLSGDQSFVIPPCRLTLGGQRSTCTTTPDVALFAFVLQSVRSAPLDNTSSRLLVMASCADGVVIGLLSRFAAHTTLRSGMLWYQILMYKLLLELVGEKKPRAKSPSTEMRVLPRKRDFACVSWSSECLVEQKIRRMKMGM